MILKIPPELAKVLIKHPINAIDIGSRGGVVAFGALESYINMIGFEVDEPEAVVLKKKIEEQSNFNSCTIESFAAWSDSQETNLYICRYLPNCSLLKPNVDCAKKFGLSKLFEIVSTKKVQCTRIESILLKKGITSIDYIKIDAQGGDLEVLKGLGDYIKDILLIRVEVLFVPLYHDAPSFGEINEFMNDNNFRLLTIEPTIKTRNIVTKTITDTGELVWADLIYTQDFEFSFPDKKFSKERILNYSLLLAFEGYESLAIDFLLSESKKQSLPDDFVQLIIETIVDDSYMNQLKRKVYPLFPAKLKKIIKKLTKDRK